MSQYFLQYSKALRSTFFGERENWCRSKFMQLLLLIKEKALWSNNCATQGFHYMNSSSSNLLGSSLRTSTCKVRAAWGRASRGLNACWFWFLVWVSGNHKTVGTPIFDAMWGDFDAWWQNIMGPDRWSISFSLNEASLILCVINCQTLL